MPNSYTSDYATSSKAKPKSVRPKNVNKNIKVSQSEIDSIKKMGMEKALSSVKTGSSSFGEGVRRLYGETRYQNAIYTPKASPGPIGSAANVKENRIAAKSTRPAGESFSKPNKGTRPGAESFVPKAMKTKRGN